MKSQRYCCADWLLHVSMGNVDERDIESLAFLASSAKKYVIKGIICGSANGNLRQEETGSRDGIVSCEMHTAGVFLDIYGAGRRVLAQQCADPALRGALQSEHCGRQTESNLEHITHDRATHLRGRKLGPQSEFFVDGRRTAGAASRHAVGGPD